MKGIKTNTIVEMYHVDSMNCKFPPINVTKLSVRFHIKKHMDEKIVKRM